MKKAKFYKAFDLKANEEFEDGGDIYERGKLIGFDYISNIIQFENDQGINYEIFVNRILCNTLLPAKPATETKTSTLFKSAQDFKGTENNKNERQKLYQALISETDNANNVGDLQNINAPLDGNAGAGAGPAGCASCPNVQILTATGRGPNAPVTQTPGTDASGCSTVTISCAASNPTNQVSLIWLGQGASGGTTIGTGSATETLTCNAGGQFALNEPGAIQTIDQVECISTEPVPPPNFQAPPQIAQQPFFPQQQAIPFQGAAAAAPPPVQYSAPSFGGLSLPGWAPSLGFSCFSADTLVTTHGNKKIRMDELKVGEWILSGDSRSGEMGYSKVASWIHKKPDLMAEFLKFSLENGQELKITKKHFIYKGNCKNENSTIYKNDLEMVYAENVTIDDCLFTINDQNELISTPISKIELIQEKGIFAPLTETGNIVVNDIFASCYSNVKVQTMQMYLPSFTKIIKNILSSIGLHYQDPSLSNKNEFDLVPGFSLLINVLKDVLPQKY
uniref:Ig-like domain-containing protein n=1 Tax=Panagrolaimus sp. ES5 TaxID=591445 RepID=A0AC34FAH3_9BILA